MARKVELQPGQHHCGGVVATCALEHGTKRISRAAQGASPNCLLSYLAVRRDLARAAGDDRALDDLSSRWAVEPIDASE